MSIIRHKMNSRKWISNAKDYIIEGKTHAVNAWCLEKNVCSNMVSNEDLVAICYEENENVEMVGKVIACGKSNMAIPRISPSCKELKVSDVFNIKFVKKRILLGNEVKNYVSEFIDNCDLKECIESNYINCLNCNDSIKDFLYEINNGLNSKESFSVNSNIGYVIFVPLVFSFNYESAEKNLKNKINFIKLFNNLYRDEIKENSIAVSSSGKIILQRIIR